MAPRTLFAPRDLPPLGPDVAHQLETYRGWVVAREAERLAERRGRPTRPGTLAMAVLLVLEHNQTGASLVRHTIDCLLEQTTSAWRLSVVSVGGPDPGAVDGWEEVRRLGLGRLTIGSTPPGTSTAIAYSSALTATGEPLVMLLAPGDELAPDAVELLADALTEADVAYGDEDILDADGQPVDPRLKPDWSPELLLSLPYLGAPVAVNREVLQSAGGILPVPDGDWWHDLWLRVTERTDRVTHVAEVLCHRAGTGRGATSSGSSAVASALRRRGEPARLEPGPLPGSWAIHHLVSRRLAVDVIVPFRDGPRFLRNCVDSVTATAGDVELRLLLVDNGSVEPETQSLIERLAGRSGIAVLEDRRPFNWAAINNLAARSADGDVLVFLNNDIEAKRRDWLEALSAQVIRPHVGAAGARLLYPTGRLQHCGMALGLGGAAGHLLAGLEGNEPGYLGIAVLARNCSAVTGACMATRRQVFADLGGFDEAQPLDLNDVDYCLRLWAAGLAVVYEPRAELVHYESPTRGTSGTQPDIVRFLDHWEAAVLAGDHFVNRNLSRLDSSCRLKGPDEEGWWRRWRSTLTES